MDKVKDFPTSPGVYLMKDSSGNILYVGKAKNLRNRVRSYFYKEVGPKTKKLVSKIHDIEYVVVSTEKEALLTELNFITKHKPPFNIKLKNEISYPFIFIDLDRPSPFFEVSSNPKKTKGVKKFGPYPYYHDAYNVSRLLNESFGLRTCSDNTLRHRQRPCILFDMGKCVAPCVKKVSKEEYDALVQKALASFTKKGMKDLIKNLEKEMKALAASENFEGAQLKKEAWQSWLRIKEEQSVVSAETDTFLFVTNFKKDKEEHVIALEFKEGRFWGLEKGVFLEDSEQDHITSFVLSLSKDIPVSSSSDLSALEDVGFKIKKLSKKTMDSLETIARENFEKTSRKTVLSSTESEEVRVQLGIEKLEKIECYDISHLQGSFGVGSRVVWEHGQMNKPLYRKYKLKHNQGNNDFLSLQEVLERRVLNSSDPLPDILLIDGGLAQIKAVEEILVKHQVQGVLLLGIEKSRTESNFQEDTVKSSDERIINLAGEETALEPRTSIYRLLTTLRNEAHRFAIEYHRKLRSKNIILETKTSKN